MPRIRTIKPEFWSSPGIETTSPWIRVELGLRGDEWKDAKGLTGVADTVPLNRDGLRVTVRRWADIRRSCLRALEADVRRERSGESSDV